MAVAQRVQAESTDLVILDKLTPAVIFAPGGVDDVLEKIAREVRSQQTDISTKSGRDAVASLAYKVARSKTALDKMGKELGETHYKSWKAITAERSRIETELDALRDEVRKPLNDWENAEKDRIAGHEAALAAMEGNLTFDSPEPSSTDIRERLDASDQPQARHWEEFAKRASELRDRVRAGLIAMLATAEKREADRAELARLRAEQIAREQKERDDRIAAEAAERARIEAEKIAAKQAAEAEEKAQRAAEEARVKAEAERKRVEKEKADAIARAEKAEADRVAAAAKAKQDAKDAAEAAELERQRIQAKAAAEAAAAEERVRAAEAARVAQAEQSARDAKAAVEAAERRQQAAIEAERKRVADEAAAAASETAKREANKKHLAKINNEVLAALVACGASDEIGKAIIGAVARGEVPHTKIAY